MDSTLGGDDSVGRHRPKALDCTIRGIRFISDDCRAIMWGELRELCVFTCHEVNSITVRLRGHKPFQKEP